MVEFRKYSLVGVLLCMGMVCMPIFYCSESHQNIEPIYQITHNRSDGLKTYANFTGTQFLIINHDAFDWMDVTVAVNVRKGDPPVIVEPVDGNQIRFTVPRIRAGEMYTLQTYQLTAQTSPAAQTLPTQAYSLRILGATPRGPSAWDGRWEPIVSRAP
jgi:hypothetical protein